MAASNPLPRDHVGEALCGVSTTPGRATDRIRLAVSIGLFGFGVFAFCRLFATTGVGSVLSLLRAAGAGVALVLVAPVVGQVLNLFAWMVLLPADARPPVFRGYRILLAAQAGNELGSALLGEPLKVIAVPRRHREEAAAAIVLDNVVCFVVVCTFLGVGAALWPHRSLFEGALGAVRWALPVAALVASAVFVVARRFRGSARFVVERRLRGVLDACSLVLRRRPRAVAASFLLHVGTKLWLFAELWLALRLFGHGSLRESLLLGIASMGGSMIGAPVPAQLGVVESTVVFAAATAGIPIPVALAVVVLRRIRACSWILAGALLLPSMKGSS